MILPFPLATSGEIAAVLRPGAGLRPDSALRTLRENNLAGVALSVVPRTSSAAHGRAVWYSSLMLDVARLYRWHDLDAAAEVLVQANELASHRAATFVAEALRDAGLDPDARELDAASGGALSRLALLTESRRNKLGSLLRIRRSTGTIVGRMGELAIVEAEDGLRLGVPAPSPEQATLGNVGASVAVDAEQLDPRSSVLWVRPGFEAQGDQHARVQGLPRLLTEDEGRRIARDVLVVG